MMQDRHNRLEADKGMGRSPASYCCRVRSLTPVSSAARSSERPAQISELICRYALQELLRVLQTALRLVADVCAAASLMVVHALSEFKPVSVCISPNSAHIRLGRPSPSTSLFALFDPRLCPAFRMPPLFWASLHCRRDIDH